MAGEDVPPLEISDCMLQFYHQHCHRYMFRYEHYLPQQYWQSTVPNGSQKKYTTTKDLVGVGSILEKEHLVLTRFNYLIVDLLKFLFSTVKLRCCSPNFLFNLYRIFHSAVGYCALILNHHPPSSAIRILHPSTVETAFLHLVNRISTSIQIPKPDPPRFTFPTAHLLAPQAYTYITSRYQSTKGPAKVQFPSTRSRNTRHPPVPSPI